MDPGDDAAWTPDRNLKVVSGVSFLQDTASELLYPVLPFLVTGLLGGSPAVLGAIEGAARDRSGGLRHRAPERPQGDGPGPQPLRGSVRQGS